jgi:putative hydrolase of the HAD superfamily
MAKPTAILFDFGGTLDGLSHWLDRFLKHYGAAGVKIRRDELDPAFAYATRAGYMAGPAIQRFKLKDLVRFLAGNQLDYLRSAGPASIRAQLEAARSRGRFALAETIADSFLKETAEGLGHSRATLRRLRPLYKMGVVSNWYGNLKLIVAEAGFDRFLDAVIDSTRVGVYKPDPAVFMAALSELRVTAEQTAMVGDSILKDCVPAHRIGMRTLLLRADGRPAERADSAIEFAPDYVIKSLDELVDFRW